MSSRILLSLLIAVLIVVPSVYAESVRYVIPLEGSKWKSSIIQVHVSGGEEWQRNQTLQALLIWNRAQLWIASEYFPNSSVYTFEEGDSNAPVQVTLLNSGTVVGSIEAWTDYHAQKGVIESATVKIADQNTQEALLLLNVHELGHVLGLGHVSCCDSDLMIPYPVDRQASYLPTTLDLYAVHVLGTSEYMPTLVFLPNSIPYRTIPEAELTLPESLNFLAILLVVPVITLFSNRKKKP